MPINKNKSSQKGNIFAVLFGAVALTGVLAAVSMQTVTGPVRTVTKVTQKNMVDNDLMTANKIIIATAAAQTDDGDCDADGFVEPAPWRDAGSTPAPTGGGLLPNTIGANTIDPWGSEYGYCVWDHRTVDAAGCGGASQLRLQGPTAILSNQMVLAVVSAGPDKTFQTTCRDWLDANTDNEPDNPLIEKTVGSDDYIVKQTYIEAANTGGGQGLWNIKDADANVAEIGKDLEVKNASNAITVAIDSATGVGDFLGLTTDVITPRNTTTNRIDLDGFLDFSRADVPNGEAYITIDHVGQLNEEIGMIMRLDGDSKTSSGTDIFMRLQSDAPGIDANATDRFVIYGDGRTEIYGESNDGDEVLYLKKIADNGGQNALHLDTTNDRNIGMRFSNQGVRQWDIYNDGAIGTDNNRLTIAGATSYNADKKLVILQNGNVGIGAEVPAYNLHIDDNSGDEGSPGIFIEDPTTASATHGGKFYFDDRSGQNLIKMSAIDNNIETGYVAIDRASGSVGINYNTPTVPLDINGGVRIRSGNGISIGHNFAPTTGIDLQGDLKFRGTSSIYTGGAQTINIGDGNDTVTIKTNHTFNASNVGINTASVQATLDVDGYMRLKANSSAPATCAGTNAGAIALTSAYRMCVCNGTAWTEVNSATACSW